MELTKYFRTPHLPRSPGATSDDLRLTGREVAEMFSGRDVVVTEKVDGENTSVYSDGYTHARSRDSKAHPSRTHMRALARALGTMGIPDGWKLYGEYAYARHSIAYDRLPGYFMLFAVVDETGLSLPWESVEEWAALLDLPTVPVIYRGPFADLDLANLYPFTSSLSTHGEPEGYVVRTRAGFNVHGDRPIAKYVRENHVQTDDHWMFSEIVPNTLRP